MFNQKNKTIILQILKEKQVTLNSAHKRPSLQITLGNIFALPRKAGSGSLNTTWMPLLRPQPSFAASTSNGACEPHEAWQSCCLTTLIVDLQIDWRLTSLLLKRNSCALNADMFKACSHATIQDLYWEDGLVTEVKSPSVEKPSHPNFQGLGWPMPRRFGKLQWPFLPTFPGTAQQIRGNKWLRMR